MKAANSNLMSLLEGSLALIRKPQIDADIKRKDLALTTLRMALEVSTELLETVNDFTHAPGLEEAIATNRELLKTVRV